MDIIINFAQNAVFEPINSLNINTIHVLGVKILEPVATITDILVSIVCIFAFYKIHKTGKKEKTFTYFKLYFLIMAVATLLGGLIGHAFLYSFTFAWKLPGWITSMFSIMFVERATIEHTKITLKPQIIKILRVVNTVELLMFLSLTLFTLNFAFVEFHSGYGLMFVVLSLQSYLFYKTRNKASKTILIGIAFAAVAAFFFMFKIDIHQWFNHLAASHALMSVAAFIFYKGVIKIEMKK